MASNYGYHPYSEQPQVLVPSTAYGYGHGQYYDVDQPKTPNSLVTHPGHSPVPLSTPPMSRNASQPPPDHLPEQMVYDGSQSNSPISVKTPDNEIFDVDMLDEPEAMRQHYYQNPLEGNVTTRMPQHSVPAIDSTMFFSEQGLREALNATLASQSQSQSQSQYNSFFTAQIQTSQGMVPAQQYHHSFSHQYPTQPSGQEPWSSQRSPLNPNEPRSSIAFWDPASDPVSYSPFVSSDVSQWTHENTDPNYLISPSEPLAPPQDNFFALDTRMHHHHHQHDHSPVDIGPSVSYSQPQTSLNFISYDPSTEYFTNDYGTGSQYLSPSSNSSIMGSSMEQLPRSPFQAAISPQALSISSPGASDVMVSSYQHSDSGPSTVTPQTLRYEVGSVPPSSPAQVEPLSIKEIPEVTFDSSPEPEPQSRSQLTAKGASGRAGGRQLGTHLDAKVAKAAHDMRKIVACWHCVLQRDRCGPGDSCDRCLKRSQRPNADNGLGCSRIKLVELTHSFLPSLVTQMHEDNHLTHFCSQYIGQWMNVEITIYMTCGQSGMPRIPVKVYEFSPIGEELLVQIQYITDVTTHERKMVPKRSPALGMVHINHNEEKRYDKYISDIVDNHIDAFGDLCWRDDDNDFQEKLFRLMTRIKPKNDDEAKLIREVFRLIVVTFIMSHTLTIAEETKHSTLSKMHSYNGNYDNYTSPRMANRQLKYFFNRLQNAILSAVLNKLQQIFKSSKGCDKWLAAFIAVVGMCMAHEDQQKTIHCVMETKARTEGWDLRDAQARADIACREIDTRMAFVTHIFRLKYNRKFNPLRDADHDWDKEVGFGGESSVNFVRQVAQLVRDNIDYLNQRRGVSISAANQTKYTSRLVSEFLMSFWLPS